MEREFTEPEIRVELTRLRDEVGGVRSLAERIGVSPGYVCDVLLGRRAPGPDFLKVLGIRKEVIVRYVRDREGVSA
jgi:hypothetical protein